VTLLKLFAENRTRDVGAEQQKPLPCDLATLGQRIGQRFGDEALWAKIDVKGEFIPNCLRSRVADGGDFGSAEDTNVSAQGAESVAREANAVGAGEDDPVPSLAPSPTGSRVG